MKLVVRADDAGYTHVHNLGTFRAMDEGLITSVDVMLDCTGTAEMLAELRKRPWLSVGWHSHFWGSPVANPLMVPSMINDKGRFLGRDHSDPHARDAIRYDEAVIEMRAELERCISILGRVPDTAQTKEPENDFEQAMADVVKEYGIATNFMERVHGDEIQPAAEKFSHCNICCVDAELQYIGAKQINGKTTEYDPMKFYENYVTQEMIESDVTYVTPWHPGYLDETPLSESTMNWCRVADVSFLCSKKFRDYILEYKIELVNFRDALYGSQEYQNHLKVTDEDLYRW